MKVPVPMPRHTMPIISIRLIWQDTARLLLFHLMDNIIRIHHRTFIIPAWVSCSSTILMG
jgi:hypothetical protein